LLTRDGILAEKKHAGGRPNARQFRESVRGGSGLTAIRKRDFMGGKGETRKDTKSKEAEPTPEAKVGDNGCGRNAGNCGDLLDLSRNKRGKHHSSTRQFRGKKRT